MMIIYECGYCGNQQKQQGNRCYPPVCHHYKEAMIPMMVVGAYTDCAGYRLHVIPATLSG